MSVRSNRVTNQFIPKGTRFTSCRAPMWQAARVGAGTYWQNVPEKCRAGPSSASVLLTASKFGVLSGRIASMNALPDASAAAITAASSVAWLQAGFSHCSGATAREVCAPGYCRVPAQGGARCCCEPGARSRTKTCLPMPRRRMDCLACSLVGEARYTASTSVQAPSSSSDVKVLSQPCCAAYSAARSAVRLGGHQPASQAHQSRSSAAVRDTGASSAVQRARTCTPQRAESRGRSWTPSGTRP
jgi:hypothetical protein